MTLLERGLLSQTPDLLKEHLPEGTIGIVCDETTYGVAAEALYTSMADRAVLVQLGKRIRPTIDLSEKLRRQVASCSSLLAVGSGTITDLTRYVAHRLEIPFAVFATAPSMNGYLSPTASLIFGKQKSSVQASPPSLVIADIDTLMEAPLQLVRAGIGDVLCRSSVESDLILANHFTGTTYKPDDFTRLREIDDALRTYDGEMHRREEKLIRLLMEALFIGGRLMQEHGSSAPCSQGEHMIAHTYDMLYGGTESNVLHGEAIAVTTLTMAKLQQKLIHRKPKLRPIKPSLDQFRRTFGQAGHEALFESYNKKLLTAERCEEINDQMATKWKEIQAEVESKAMALIQLESTLTILGCKTDHRQLRWHRARYENAVNSAHLTRDRFTFLDIPAMDRILRAEI